MSDQKVHFMFKGLKVYLVIPAYNEEKLIEDTLSSVPNYVDKILVVDDGSTDTTSQIVNNHEDERVELIKHEQNKGVGAAIITGYKKSASEKADVVVVVGGDNQMPLDEMNRFLEPFADDEVDYVKGNRFLSTSLKDMPFHRLFGNSFLSLMTKVASGYWKIFDTQDGYTAISRRAIETVEWDKAYKKYGYVSDFLIRLNIYNFRVKDVARSAIYLPGERQSQINITKYILNVTPMLIKGFFWRLKEKYLLRDFHPLIFFYMFGLILLPAGLLVGLWTLYNALKIGVSVNWAVLTALLLITGFQSLLFAMLFDMEMSRSE